MRNKLLIIMLPIAMAFYIAILSIYPPIKGNASPKRIDTFFAPAADGFLDTPALIERQERVNKKVEVLKERTKIISENSKELEQQTNNLKKAVSDIDLNADRSYNDTYDSFHNVEHLEYDLKGMPVIIRDTCYEDQHNFWYRLKHLF